MDVMNELIQWTAIIAIAIWIYRLRDNTLMSS